MKRHHIVSNLLCGTEFTNTPAQFKNHVAQYIDLLRPGAYDPDSADYGVFDTYAVEYVYRDQTDSYAIPYIIAVCLSPDGERIRVSIPEKHPSASICMYHPANTHAPSRYVLDDDIAYVHLCRREHRAPALVPFRTHTIYGTRHEHIIRCRDARNGFFALSIVPEGERARQEHGGPYVPGPWASIYPLAIVITTDTANNTANRVTNEIHAGDAIYVDRIGRWYIVEGTRDGWNLRLRVPCSDEYDFIAQAESNKAEANEDARGGRYY